MQEIIKHFYLQIVEDIIKLGQVKGWNVPRFKITDVNAGLFFNPMKKIAINRTKPIPKKLGKDLELDEYGHFYEYTEQDIWEQIRKIIQ